MVAHYTPGKRWDSFYTWDSGFIGLGLAQADAELGRRVLEQYLSGPENSDFAFVHHGSLVPVQFYLYQDLLARAQDKAGLLRLYPAMRRYYEFLAGRGEGSTPARFASGLLTNYDYFYNASGMDDYAAQVLMHAKGLSGRAAPVLFTAHVIRAAKILRQSARRLGLVKDEERCGRDIERLSPRCSAPGTGNAATSAMCCTMTKEGRRAFCARTRARTQTRGWTVFIRWWRAHVRHGSKARRWHI